MTPAAQHAAIYALTMRLQSLSLSLRDRSGDGPELVAELLRCSRVALDIAEEAAGLANRLEDECEENEVPDAEEEHDAERIAAE